MKLRYSRRIMMLGVIIRSVGFPVHAQESTTSVVSDVLSLVQKNVETIRTLAPDFICDERVTYQNINKGKVTKENVIVSKYRIVRKDLHGPKAPPDFVESREVKTATINNKTQTLSKYEPPIGVAGGFYDDLFILFDRENEKCLNFELAGSEKLRDRTSLVLQIYTKENVESNGGKCKLFRPGEKNKAWIDSESMQVIRLQRTPVKYGESHSPLPILEFYFIHRLIDYDKVIINDRSYWLPSTKRVEFIKAKSQQSKYLYVLEYSDYHMFQVSTKVSS